MSALQFHLDCNRIGLLPFWASSATISSPSSSRLSSTTLSMSWLFRRQISFMALCTLRRMLSTFKMTDVDGPDMMMMKPSERGTVHVCPVGHKQRCVRALKTRVLPLGCKGHSQSQGSSSSASWHRRSFLKGRHMSASRVKGNKKNCSLSAHMSSWFNGVRLKSHVLQEEEKLCVPAVLLCVVGAFGGYAYSDDVESAHRFP